MVRTLGIPLVAGRDFNEHDMMDHPNVILISASGAKTVFGNENPIGKTLLITSGSVPVEIVGVVGDVRSVRLDQHNDMEFYRPFAQENFPFLTITVRSSLPPDTVTKSVQAALKTIDPSLALILPQPVERDHGASARPGEVDDGVARRFCRRRVVAGDHWNLRRGRLHGGTTHRRDRCSDGARRANACDVLRLVVSQGMKPVVIGLAIGLVAAFALGRLLTSQLFEVSAHNPALLGGATILLAVIALAACLLPARRAAMVDPVQALRAE